MLKIISKKNRAAEIICNLNKVDNKQLKEIKSTLDKYGMIYFPKQKLTSKNYLNFAKKFGKPANYPRLKGLNKKYPQITVVQRKSTDKGPSFGEQFHTDSSYTKKPPRYTMLLSKLVPKKGVANTDFSSQYLAYEKLSKNYKNKLKKLKGIYSSHGPISITTVEREKEKGKISKELISRHKIIRTIKNKKTIYCSPGHFLKFNTHMTKQKKELKKFLFNHQTKKTFQYSLEWEKDQLAIWDNRAMLHQATPFKGNRILHRITIL